MDARKKCAVGMGANAIGWLAFGAGTVNTGLHAALWVTFALPWGGLAIAWWFDADTFSVPIETWRDEQRLFRHLPSALFVVGIGWAVAGVGFAVLLWTV